MRSRRALLVSLSVGCICAVLIVFFALRTRAGSTVETTSLGGTTAPSIEGRQLLSTSRVSLRSLRGRYVVVDFFASWCAPCVAEEPEVQAFAFEHRNDRSTGFIGVDIDDSVVNARAFLTRYGATWPAIADSTGSIAQSYGVANPPELFLIDPRGKIISSITQAVNTEELSNWVSEAKAAGA